MDVFGMFIPHNCMFKYHCFNTQYHFYGTSVATGAAPLVSAHPTANILGRYWPVSENVGLVNTRY